MWGYDQTIKAPGFSGCASDCMCERMTKKQKVTFSKKAGPLNNLQKATSMKITSFAHALHYTRHKRLWLNDHKGDKH